MRFYAHEKLALLVDGANFWNTFKALGFDIDFGKMQEFFAHQSTLVSSVWFTQMNEREEFTPIKPVIDWLVHHGWQAVIRQKDTDVDLAVFAIELADHVDHIVLVSGDSDFVSLVHLLKRRAVRVSVLSTVKAPGRTGAICSEDLRKAADQFIELADLREIIARPARSAKEALSV